MALTWGDGERPPPPVQRDVIGPEALRDRLRLLAPEKKSLVVYREDVALTLRLLDELQVSEKGRTGVKRLKRRKRQFEEVREKVSEIGRIDKLLRLRPDVVAKVESFAKARGGAKPWAFNHAVNELLASALLSERDP